jgi:hypothetical protein
MKDKTKISVDKIILLKISDVAYIWRVIGSNGNMLQVTTKDLDAPFELVPFIFIHGNPRVKVEIPDEFKYHPSIQEYLSVAEKLNNNHTTMARTWYNYNVSQFGKEDADKLLSDQKDYYKNICLDLKHGGGDIRPIKLRDLWTIAGADFLRPKVLRTIPQEGWKSDEGDSQKMVYDKIPGQKTVVLVKNGPFRGKHLTNESYSLLNILWTKYFEDDEPREGAISYADICSRLGITPSGTEYNRIEKRLEELMHQTIYFERGGRIRGMLNLLGYWHEEKGPTGKLIRYQITLPPNARKTLFQFDPKLISGLNPGQNNIVREVLSHEPKPIPELGNLEYHHYWRSFNQCVLEMAYLPGKQRGDRHVRRFIKDLDELKKMRATNPENPQYPGFTYEIRPVKGYADLPIFEGIEETTKDSRDFPDNRKIIHFYHYKTRG